VSGQDAVRASIYLEVAWWRWQLIVAAFLFGLILGSLVTWLAFA
jgi:hypothetical protein